MDEYKTKKYNKNMNKVSFLPKLADADAVNDIIV